MSLHRLVCVTFHGPRPVGQVTRHLDGDPNHNCPSNLAYGTPAENAEDMRRHGTHAASRRTHCPQGHEYNTQNTRWTADGHRDCLGCVRERSRRKVQCPACGVTLSRGSMHRHALRFHGASWGNLTAEAVAS